MKQSKINKVLITGCAGFIGFHITKTLLKDNYKCYGIDNLNEYYDKKLKLERLRILKKSKNFKFEKIDLSKTQELDKLKNIKFCLVINLAAQAGVRYAFEKPNSYISSNITGFLNLLNFMKNQNIGKLIFASTSSVYGDNETYPWSEKQILNKPLTIYSSSKIFNENLAYSYSKYYGIQSLGLRFFTVYGEYGRPDMSIYKFTKNIMENKEILIFNKGNHSRDFTHIDIIKNIFSKLLQNKKWKEIFKNKNFEIINIAGGSKIKLLRLVKLIEKYCKKKAKKKYIGLQMGDIKQTSASLIKLKKYKLSNKKIAIEKGIKRFVLWYRKYARI